MNTESTKVRLKAAHATEGAAMPMVADRETFEARLTALRAREKDYTHQGDAIAAERRRLPMVEVDPAIKLMGANGRSRCSIRLKGAGN
jgi:predicted dithiol-disulfide oxidoreductase (DUF899 family)